MNLFDETCGMVLRAAYQVSGFTGAPVTFEQIAEVVPIAPDELQRVVVALQARGWAPVALEGERIALTPEGVDIAARLPPVSEPPLFQDI